MSGSPKLEQLIECLIQVIGRAAVPEQKVREIVGDGAKQIKAFNLCDGTRTQLAIAKQARIDQGSLSRTSQRWVENGVAFWVGEGHGARLLHIYPLSKRAQARKRGKRR